MLVALFDERKWSQNIIRAIKFSVTHVSNSKGTLLRYSSYCVSVCIKWPAHIVSHIMTREVIARSFHKCHVPGLSHLSIIATKATSPFPVAARSKTQFCGHSPAEVVDSSPTAGMDVCFECYVLSGRDLCYGLITRQGESYLVWCVAVCDLETS